MASTANDEDSISVQDNTPVAANWAKYVSTFLPLERAEEFSIEEQAVVQLVVKQIGEEAWGGLPKEIQLNVLRGNAHHGKDHVKQTSENALSIYKFRKHHECDVIPFIISDVPASLAYFQGWPSWVAGCDDYGHPILCDRIARLDMKRLATLPEEAFFRYRTLALEALMFKKQEISNAMGERVSKHVYVLDLSGLDVGKHFAGGAVQRMMQKVIKMSSDMFPETLWQIWLINAPLTFRMVWNVVRGWLDPLVRAKVRMFGSTKSKWQTAMAQCSIQLSQLPMELGGTYANTESLHDIVLRVTAAS